ncbi:isoprenoid biosynthesis glyoxalase ElbB [Vibrio nigripulchritudo]|uniref:isoprenoid biosynthesis glyoxalase ElbB n=1 Tax=Vibrio nigripulchritudo TaxID=28173 RepID=UPI0005FA89FC|nr:isoprenoid biosynthesis glyoxalase ElbB [Vibrio nigripulchritudo]KJY72112.1 isoprenoid biosynthesis protein [Vibrio nigripulchritudo]
MKKVAVILSGCGVYDGAEIHEAVLSLFAIEQNGASWHCFAPDISQHHVIDHLKGEEVSETRNVLTEAARIARGNIQDVASLNVSEFDALLVPGGFGAAKNLSTFAFEGKESKVDDTVLSACKAFASAGKPAGYMCIAPALLPEIYGQRVKLTIGTDAETAATLETMGAEHVDCQVSDIVVDEANKLITTPAYMLAGSISEASSGINKLVKALLDRL